MRKRIRPIIQRAAWSSCVPEVLEHGRQRLSVIFAAMCPKDEAGNVLAEYQALIDDTLAQAMRKPGRRHCDPMRRRVRQASVRRRITRTHRAITLSMARMGMLAYMGRQVSDWSVPRTIFPHNRFFAGQTSPVWREMALIRLHRDLYPT